MHLKSALFVLNVDAFEYSWDETGGATRIGLALLLALSANGPIAHNNIPCIKRD